LYGLPLDVFSYGAVVLYTITEQWPRPISLPFDSKMSEVQRRQHYIDQMVKDAAELKPLVVSCLHNDPKRRPTIENVSKAIKAYMIKTDASMGKPNVWWVGVSNGHQLEQQRQTSPIETQITTLNKQIDDLKATILNRELNQQIMAQFINGNKKVKKSYTKFVERHKQIEQGKGVPQQLEPVRCGTGSGESLESSII